MRTETISILNGQLNAKTKGGDAAKQLFTVDPASLGFDRLLQQHSVNSQSAYSRTKDISRSDPPKREASPPPKSGKELPTGRDQQGEIAQQVRDAEIRNEKIREDRRRQDEAVSQRRSEAHSRNMASKCGAADDFGSDRHSTLDHKASSTDSAQAEDGLQGAVKQQTEQDQQIQPDTVDQSQSLTSEDQQSLDAQGSDQAEQLMVLDGASETSSPLEAQTATEQGAGLSASEQESLDLPSGQDGTSASHLAQSETLQQENALKQSAAVTGIDIADSDTTSPDAMAQQAAHSAQGTNGESVGGQAKSDLNPEQVMAVDTTALSTSQDSVQSSAEADTKLSSRAGATATNASQLAGLAENKSQAQQQSGETETDNAELTAEKKFELPLTGKNQIKTGAGEAGNVTTPVQERLAALARSMEQGNSDKRGTERNPKASSLDGIKSLASLRSGDSPATAQNGSFSRNLSAVQTPVPSSMQATMQAREWASELGQKLMMMVSTKIQSAQIQLNPRDMGPIDVRVVMQQEQAHVVFSSQVLQTREALEQALPRLREMFDQNGVDLANVDVRDQDAQQSQQRQSQQAQDGKSWQGEDQADDIETSETEVTLSQGLVDYYA